MSGERPRHVNRDNAFVQFFRWVFGIGYERNIGGMERTVRYTAGIVFTLAGIAVVAIPILGDALGNAALAAILFVVGVYLIYEARVQYCPLNHALDRSTYTPDDS